MSHKTVSAIAIATVALSIGIVHFNPKNPREHGRYQNMVLPNDDAAKAVRMEVAEITGDATQADYDKWKIDIAAAEDPNIDSVIRSMKAAGGGSPAVSSITAVAHPPGAPALAAGDSGPGSGSSAADAATGDPLAKAGVKELAKGLQDVDDLERIKALYLLELAKPEEEIRGGALSALEARANKLDNEAFDNWKAEMAEAEDMTAAEQPPA